MGIEVNTVIALKPADETRLRERMTAASVPPARLRWLKDGTLLFSSFVRFDVVDDERLLVVKWLRKTFGEDLSFAHGDARGIAIFPDRCKPKAKTYERLIEELADDVTWVPVTLQQLKREVAAQKVKRAEQAKRLPPRSPHARGYEGGELVDEVTGEIVRTRKHTDAPDNYEAELAALGLGSGNSSPSAFDDDDSEEDYDEDDDDEDNDDDRHEDEDDLVEFGLPEPKKRVPKPTRQRKAAPKAKTPTKVKPKRGSTGRK